MAEIVTMPKLSDTMTEGTVVKWHKKVGDTVKAGELLAEIETDKATMDFESFQSGTLLYIGVEEKKSAPVDAILAILGQPGEDISSLIKSGNGSGKIEVPKVEESKAEEKVSSVNSSAAASAIPAGVEIVRMPKLSDTMTEGTVVKWHKKEGDKVKAGELLAEIETDKATMDFESFQSGVLIYRGVEEGKSAVVDSILAILGNGNEDVNSILKALSSGGTAVSGATVTKGEDKTTSNAASQIASTVQLTITAQPGDGRIKASPLAKALAKEKGIDLKLVKGTGEGGRIVKADIENFKPSAQTKSTAGAQTSVAGFEESFEDADASQMRKTIARRLTESKQNAPHYYLTMEIDMDECIRFRENLLKLFPEPKISFNDIVLKAVAMALRKHPKVNASWMGDKIRYYHHIHVGMAVAIEDGLLVPVIRFADKKPLSAIATETRDLAKRAKERKLQPQDWEGNTFTVSNLGMFGIESFTSIINTPESCILSVGAIRQVPVVKNGQVVPGNVMKVTLACDHRSVDGATGSAFLQTLKNFLENPAAMLH
jgi:pyruvate dehydrogenase E2 component (dihydrolipoamide acetyltransferase)